MSENSGTFLNALQMLFFLLMKNLVFRDINDATTKLLGYSKNYVVTLSLFQFTSQLMREGELY